MPAPTVKHARKGSAEWKVQEVSRFMDIARKHDGLTSAWFVAIALGVSRQRVYAMVEQGILHPVELLGKMLFKGDEVLRVGAMDRTRQTRYTAAGELRAA